MPPDQRQTISPLTRDDITRLFCSERKILEKDVDIYNNPEVLYNLDSSRKLIAMLSHLGLGHRIKKCIQLGATDYWLPITTWTDLKLSPGELGKVEEFQSTFLHDAYDFRQFEGAHATLSSNATKIYNGNLTIPLSFVNEGSIGHGAHGRVIRIKVEDKLFALKMFDRADDPEARAKQAQGEIQVLKKVRDERLRHSVEIVGSYTDDRTIGIMMTPVTGYNLGDLLEEYSTKTNKHERIEARNHLAKFFGCLAAAIHDLHCRLKIRHKDIKPANILVDQKGTILLTDFGLSLNWELHGRTTTQEEDHRSLQYCAPEVAKGPGSKKRSSSDIWSLGCVFLEIIAIMSGKSLTFLNDIMEGKGYFASPEGISDIIATLKEGPLSLTRQPLRWTEQMLSVDQETRPKAKTLVKDIHQQGKSSRVSYWADCCDPGSLKSPTPKQAPVQAEPGPSVAAEGSALSSEEERVCEILHPRTGEFWPFNMIACPGAKDHWMSRDVVEQIGLNLEKDGKGTQTLYHQDEYYQSDQFVTTTWAVKDDSKIRRGKRFYVCIDKKLPSQIVLSRSKIP